MQKSIFTSFEAYLKMAFGMLLIGSYVVASKVILSEVPVFTASFFRQFFALVAVCGFIAHQKLPVNLPSRRDTAILCFQAFVGVFLFSIFILYGLKRTSALEAGLLMSTTPISISLIAVIFLGESLSCQKAVGIGVTFLGALAINTAISAHASGEAHNSIVGNLLVFLAVFAEAVFLTFGKLLSRPLHPVVLAFWMTMFGSILFFVPASFELDVQTVKNISLKSWALLVYSGVAITALAVILMNDGMRTVPTSTASVFTALMPVSSTLLAVIFLNEAFSIQQAGGAALILLGIFIVVSKTGSGSKSKIA